MTANGNNAEPIRTAVTAGAGVSRWQKANGGTIANKDLGLMSVAPAGKKRPDGGHQRLFPAERVAGGRESEESVFNGRYGV